jgi:DNA polymerase/3'-5' exonuclease PolX
MSAEVQRWAHSEAMPVARELVAQLEPFCERIMVCGSLRRQKQTVGDIEMVYVPRMVPGVDRSDLLAPPEPVNQVDRALEFLLGTGYIEQRLNVEGRATWGPENKLGRHMESGIPVDFFSSRPEAWWSQVVCRTGGLESNTRLATVALQRGWKFRPYAGGFEGRERGNRGVMHLIQSEREAFEFLGLPYQEPEARR